ncbi:unnamed protein product, partial [marine sediment metagenome]
LVKYGGGITQMSGSMAGNTFARNKMGNYLWPRTKPVNPRSARQITARNRIMLLAEQWRTDPMDDLIRGAWETYAKNVNWHNRLSEVVILTGFNHFIRSNAALLAAGGSLVTAGPPDIGLPPGDDLFAVTGTATSGKLTITISEVLDWFKETGAYLSVEMGRPQSPSRTSFHGPYRNAGSIAGLDDTGPTPPHELDAPFTLIETQQVWCRARIIRKDARCSTFFGAAPFVAGA